MKINFPILPVSSGHLCCKYIYFITLVYISGTDAADLHELLSVMSCLLHWVWGWISWVFRQLIKSSLLEIVCLTSTWKHLAQTRRATQSNSNISTKTTNNNPLSFTVQLIWISQHFEVFDFLPFSVQTLFNIQRRLKENAWEHQSMA